MWLTFSLFFKDYHNELLHTIRALASQAVIVAPARGDSMQLFLDKARPFFAIQVDECPVFAELLLSEAVGGLQVPSDQVPHLIRLSKLID